MARYFCRSALTLMLRFNYPGIGHVFGGFIGGLFAGAIVRGAGRGVLAGFSAGFAGGLIIADLSIIGLTVLNSAMSGFSSVLFGNLA
jgi:hypothetical protein